MKKIVSLLLAAIMAVSLAGCASPLNPSSAEPGYPDENGNAEGYLNDTMHTYFFDYTVTNAYVCNEFEGYVPLWGRKRTGSCGSDHQEHRQINHPHV